MEAGPRSKGKGKGVARASGRTQAEVRGKSEAECIGRYCGQDRPGNLFGAYIYSPHPWRVITQTLPQADSQGRRPRPSADAP